MAMAVLNAGDDEEPERGGSASSDAGSPPDEHLSEDAIIRSAGFTIAARLDYTQPRWRLGPLLYLHDDALAFANRKLEIEAVASAAKHKKGDE